MTRKLLLHICCAVCLPGPLSFLQDQGFEVTGYFHNPNIHPLLEFRKRMKALKVLNERLRIPIVYDTEYGLVGFLRMLDGGYGPERCARCYRERLASTARYAAENGFEAYSSTLLVSHEQDNALILSIGSQVAEEAGIEFVAADMRHRKEEGSTLAKTAGIYRQQYCGCVFSEFDRYINTGQELYKGGER
jgi:predicted adenine nucleotide alpha hydrolase (AANH) superfamily ATPase